MSKENKERMHKLVIVPSELTQYNFGEKLLSCYDCNSNLMYLRIQYGIVKEKDEFQIMNNRSKVVYSVREIGFSVYCAECGSFIENYFKFYNNDELVYSFDMELDEDEKAEIEYCLSQFNQKGDFVPRYKFGELNIIKEALLKADKKNNAKQKLFKGKKI